MAIKTLNVADKATMDNAKSLTEQVVSKLTELNSILEEENNVVRYGIKISKSDSNPATRMTYTYDAVGMTPAKMNYSTGKFDYGSWANAYQHWTAKHWW